MKQLLNILGSMKLMAVFMLIFAAAIGYATFVENDYGTMTAKAEIYNARWFEALLAILFVNLLINIFRYKMFSLKKAPILIFHLSFLLMAVGAFVTRYIGYEGTMRIREGDTVSTMISMDSYFVTKAKGSSSEASDEQHIYLSKKSQNSLSSSLVVDGKSVEVKLKRYIPDALEQLVEGSSGGDEVLDMMVVEDGKGKQIHLKKGEFYENGVVGLDFGSGKMLLSPTVEIFSEGSELFMRHSMGIHYLDMQSGEEGTLEPSEKTAFPKMKILSANGNNFVLREHFLHATKDLVSNPKASPQQPEMDALVFDVKVGTTSKELVVIGQAGRVAKEHTIEVDGVEVSLAYGSKRLELPFALKLNKFELDRYPGSMSPASYASEVELIDEEQSVHKPFRIFMNNVLDHRGYRFFQSSYDMDEKGTVLSVNNDPGTPIAYLAYIMLGIGMFWSLLSRGNRFEQLSNRAKKLSAKSGSALALALVLLFGVQDARSDDVSTILAFDKAHATLFGKLVVQDSAGRMKPLDTMNREILAKLYRGANLRVGEHKLDPNQVVLGMITKPDIYANVKLINTKNDEINELIGVAKGTKYASFSQFFVDADTLEGYKLAEAVELANRKEPKHRDTFDNAVLEVDERANIAYAVFSGSLMKLWPKAGDENNKWHPTVEALQSFDESEALAIRDLAFGYFSSIESALTSGDWGEANKKLENIHIYQERVGSEVMPTELRVKAEMLYNELNIFESIYGLYLLVGFILLVASFAKILKPELPISILSRISLLTIVGLFLAHTFGLGLRWVVADHAPWSDGYESMIYISWATILSGIIFAKRSAMTLATTAVLTGLILFVAHLNWMNPQVTNLVPVLNSYWLSLHVAIITASYGFLGLGSLLGFIVLLLFALINESNKERLSNSIKELNAINEMGLMIGLAFLTLGNFIGGVWANESWGRYWGWDPKETWAMVTILLYAVIVHLRFIKQIYSEFSFAVVALLGYSSVIMTYFGVNYYLAGMHSYAKGDPVPIPDFVPITYAVLFLLIALAFRNRKKA